MGDPMSDHERERRSQRPRQTTAMTNRDRLIMLGRAVFGPLWQNATARALGVNSRQVHRWVSGEYEPRDRVIRDLIAIAKQKRAAIDEAIRAAVCGSGGANDGSAGKDAVG